MDKKNTKAKTKTTLSLWQLSLGRYLVLEYDTSPVGSYREWVVLGGLPLYTRQTSSSSSCVSQFGSALYVSKPAAESLCQRTWGLTAQGAAVQFAEDNSDNDRARTMMLDTTEDNVRNVSERN